MSDPRPYAHVCTADDMHPYNCYRDPKEPACIHCAREKTEDHDPETCALCNYDSE